MDYENDPLYQELTANIIHRDQLIARFMEENQYDIDSECGYPDTSILTAEDFWDRYRRDPIARRVVNILPMESWRRNPEVYDDEDEEKETPFEKSLVAAAKSIYKSYSKSDTALTHLWSCLQTADILSGVGSYGVILIGINDGRQLREPAPGFEEDAGGIYDYTSTYNERRRKEEKKSGTRKNMELTYLRPFSQKHVQVTSFETDENNFRYQQPKMYLITLNDTERSSLGLNAPHGTVEVHWSRIVHIVDTPEESELETDSRLLPVWNRLHDLQKVYGPSAEGFWQGALPGLTLQPFMEGITFGKAERDSMTKQLEMYRKKMKRYLASDAASINQLSPMVTDPSNHITVQINSICVHLAVPVRIFLGSERGELASSQDSDAHDDRMEERREKRVTPRIVCPVLDRLIDLGVLDKPQGEGYTVKWPPFRNKTPAEIAERASAITGAVAQYISGGVSELIEPLDYLTQILDLDKDTAQQLLENAEDSDFEITPPGQPPAGEAPGMGGEELPPPEEDEDLPSPQPKAPPQPSPTSNRFVFQTNDCGAGEEGTKGFQKGNTCAKGGHKNETVSYGEGRTFELYNTSGGDYDTYSGVFWTPDKDVSEEYAKEHGYTHSRTTSVTIPYDKLASSDDLLEAYRELYDEDPAYDFEAADEKKVQQYLRDKGFVAVQFRDVSPDNTTEHDSVLFLSEPTTKKK